MGFGIIVRNVSLHLLYCPFRLKQIDKHIQVNTISYKRRVKGSIRKFLSLFESVVVVIHVFINVCTYWEKKFLYEIVVYIY